jgi:serine/threonine protein kinase
VIKGMEFKLSKQWFIDSHQGNIKESYHFVERLGTGGFGVVYLAEDRKTRTFHSGSHYRPEICCEGHPKK